MPENASPAATALPVIGPVSTIDEVVAAIDVIIGWSIANASRLGYFAALYKRVTRAVDVAIKQGAFDDGPRMERLDVVFAGLYFAALNGHFHPDRFPKPARSWRVPIDGAADPDPIIAQHMIAGVNAHIDYDLGIAAEIVSPGGQLAGLHEDFDRINAVLASQVNATLDSLHELSPALADLYKVLAENETFLINGAVEYLRDSAWGFATLLARTPKFARPPLMWLRDRRVAGRGELIYHPPGLVGLIEKLIRDVAAKESRDVVHNIEVLDRIAETPAEIRTTL